MGRRHWKFDEDFKPGAVPLVVETGTPIAQVARDLGVNDGTLGELGGRDPPGRRPGVGAPAAADRLAVWHAAIR